MESASLECPDFAAFFGPSDINDLRLLSVREVRLVWETTSQQYRLGEEAGFERQGLLEVRFSLDSDHTADIPNVRDVPKADTSPSLASVGTMTGAAENRPNV
jgi:hypothetical protein